MQSHLESELSINKRLAKDCLDMIFNKHDPQQAVEQYISADYRQHNPDAQDGPPGVIEYAGGYIKANPQVHLDFKRIIAEGDYVVLHSRLKPSPSDRGLAVVDIFRVEKGKLAEHWDVMQPVPTQPSNKNGMF